MCAGQLTKEQTNQKMNLSLEGGLSGFDRGSKITDHAENVFKNVDND